jgi:hypothetical protein
MLSISLQILHQIRRPVLLATSAAIARPPLEGRLAFERVPDGIFSIILRAL